MDYDDLVKGRRREWEKLKPPEQRRAEAKARREAEIDAAEEAAQERLNAPRMPGDKSEDKPSIRKGFFDRRQERMDRARDADMVKFRHARKIAAVAAAICAVLFIGSWVVESSMKTSARQREELALLRLETRVQKGETIEIFDSATGALASWRSAWIRKQPWQIWRAMSPRLQQNTVRAKSVPIAVGEYESRIASGSLNGFIDTLRRLEGMEVVRMPLSPYREGELAIFRSKPLKHFGDTSPGQPWIVAIAYSTEVGEWRYADFREALYFNVRWETEASILPRVGGMRAIRYDDEGNQLDAIKAERAAEFKPGEFSGK